jgi:hypothetical protein
VSNFIDGISVDANGAALDGKHIAFSKATAGVSKDGKERHVNVTFTLTVPNDDALWPMLPRWTAATDIPATERQSIIDAYARHSLRSPLYLGKDGRVQATSGAWSIGGRFVVLNKETGQVLEVIGAPSVAAPTASRGTPHVETAAVTADREPTCKGMTGNGARCKALAMPTGYCRHHGNQAPGAVVTRKANEAVALPANPSNASNPIADALAGLDADSLRSLLLKALTA